LPNKPSEKIRGLGNSQTYCYLQTLLTGDNETGRKSRTFSMAEPLCAIFTVYGHICSILEN